MRDRAIKPVSFNLTDHYERELYNFSLKQQKYFSKYIKYLIEKDRSSQIVNTHLDDITPISTTKTSNGIEKQNKKAALEFL